MEQFDLFQDVAERTGGAVYIGVVDPVRTGKSTFIKNFMDLLVVPEIEDDHARERTIDELPQGGGGRTVMTTEPKFVPDDGVEVNLRDELSFRVRLVDSVGYPVEGATGYQEDDGEPRMVMTPWFEYEIPFQEAAEIGTRKVITDHSTIGVMVTADGSFGELPRENFVPAEEQVAAELKELGKPFLIILNTSTPDSPQTLELAQQLEEKYGVSVVPVDVPNTTEQDMCLILEQVLYEFPVNNVRFIIPEWVEALDDEFWLKREFTESIAEARSLCKRVRDVEPAVAQLDIDDYVSDVYLTRLDLGSGMAEVNVEGNEDLFYEVLSEVTGYEVDGLGPLMRMAKDLIGAKSEYDKLAGALQEVEEAGYGVVVPRLEDMVFEDPELVTRGNQYGIRLAARAPSLHVLRAEIDTEYTPMIGTEKQSRQLMEYLIEKFEDDPRKIWESDILGKPLHELLKEGIEDKVQNMPDYAQDKLRNTLQRIVNEGTGGLICIIL
jgi:stage IV sporulation protein A